MIDALWTDALKAEYDALPEAIKHGYPLEVYRNMGSYGRQHLIEQETEPDE